MFMDNFVQQPRYWKSIETKLRGKENLDDNKVRKLFNRYRLKFLPRHLNH